MKPNPEFIEIPKTRLWSPDEAEKRIFWARRFITEFTGISRGLGYGVFHGGSLIRDIDLIAMPWRDAGPKILDHVHYVLELCHCLPLAHGEPWRIAVRPPLVRALARRSSRPSDRSQDRSPREGP